MPQQKNLLVLVNQFASEINREVKLMELCGTHSQTVAQHNLKKLLPKNIKLITGPGCPVCVTAIEDIDTVIGLAENGIPIAIYGDLLGVPGNNSSLEQAQQKGAKIFVIYSVEEILKLQTKYPDIIFFAIGFETTAPMTAWVIKQNITVYSTHKAFLPAMMALLENKNIKIDGFIDPGHVSAIIGSNAYKQFKVPQVIAGFEPADVLLAIKELLRQIRNNEIKLVNEYKRTVTNKGNARALTLIKEVFEIKDTKWRGFGIIPKSGYEIRPKYKKLNAKVKYKNLINRIRKGIKTKPSKCLCGQVVQGIIEPKECPLFAKSCTPEKPQGACMVSAEGACHNEFKS